MLLVIPHYSSPENPAGFGGCCQRSQELLRCHPKNRGKYFDTSHWNTFEGGGGEALPLDKNGVILTLRCDLRQGKKKKTTQKNKSENSRWRAGNFYFFLFF